MSKEKYIEILHHSFDEGTPFINFTENYSYALIPHGVKWMEVSYDFEDKDIMDNHEIDSVHAYFNFCEEIEKAMGEEMNVFYLNRWKDFKTTLKGSEQEKLIALIKELLEKPDYFAEDLPVVVNKDDMDKVISKL